MAFGDCANQCDKIGHFLKYLGYKFITKLVLCKWLLAIVQTSATRLAIF